MQTRSLATTDSLKSCNPVQSNNFIGFVNYADNLHLLCSMLLPPIMLIIMLAY